jgi:hypothetical protein
MHNPHKYDREETGRSMLLAAVATVLLTFAVMFTAIWIGEESIPEIIQRSFQQVMEKTE